MEPIRDPNAIDQVIFALEMSRGFNDDEINTLVGITDLFSEEFPKKSDIKAAGVMFNPEGVHLHTQKLSGIELSTELNDHGHKIFPQRPDWQIVIDLQMIRIHCLNYTLWQDVSNKAIGYLSQILGLMNNSDVQVERVVLQYNDLFVYTGKPANYNFGDLFRQDCDLLPKRIQSSGYLWHVHQGWFDQNVLNVLNISTRMNKNDPHLSIIEHIQKSPITKLASSINSDELTTVYKDLHHKNKAILNELLVDEMKQTIGLNDD